jgi:folate-binding protein YgfZ
MTATRDFQTDYETATERCGLLDRSERGKLALTGSGAKEFLQGQVSNDVLALTPGAGCYAAFLTPKGKMLGDLRILDAGGEILLDTERSALQELFNMISRFSLGHEVELHKRTLQRGLLSLIGPASDDVASGASATGAATDFRASSSELPGDTEYVHVVGQIGPTPVRLIRTDVGIDVLCDADATQMVCAALLDAGAAGVGDAAAECVRVEHGRPLYGVDIYDTVIPQEAGLNDRAVSLTKGCYVGQETVARLHYRGRPNRQLRGLRSSEKLKIGTVLTYGEHEVGRVTSSASSPRLGEIALALVRREAPPGTVVQAGGSAHAEVVALPFPADG